MDRREPSCTVGDNVNWDSHYREHYKVSLKTKNWATIWPCNPTPGHIPREKHDPKGYMHPSVHCSTVYYNSHDMETT